MEYKKEYERRRKLGLVQTRKMSGEHKRKISESLKGHKVSQETRKKISNSEYKIPKELLEKKKIKKKCQICKNKKKRLTVHHIDGNKQNNSIRNLSILCSFCHNAVHDNGFYTRFNDNRGVMARWYK